MKISITIECDDTDELFTHLAVIKRKLKSKLKSVDSNEPFKKIMFLDNNCYGVHKVQLVDDLPPKK